LFFCDRLPKTRIKHEIKKSTEDTNLLKMIPQTLEFGEKTTLFRKLNGVVVLWVVV
jgi:hypothetical protein